MTFANLANKLTLTLATTGLVGISSIAASTPVQAATFEDFNTWSKIGVTSIINSGQVSLTTPNDELPNGFTSELQDFLGVDFEALDIDGTAFEGSAVKKTFVARAGDRFSFNWVFSTEEPATPGFNDYAFFSVNGVITQLANVLGGSLQSSPFSFTATTAGDYTFALGVVDIGDVLNDSTLTITNATYTPIPTPALLPGLIGLGLSVWRKRKEVEG